MLRLRGLNSVETPVLPGTEGGRDPFWSPDSRFIGFGVHGKLKTVPVSGGRGHRRSRPFQRMVYRGDGEGTGGGTWSTDGTILFAPSMFSGLYRVSQSGGQAAAVTTIAPRSGQRAHRWPQFLPDGRRFLFSIISTDRSDALCRLAGQPNADAHHRCQCPRALRVSGIPALHARWDAHGAAVRQPFTAINRPAAQHRRSRRHPAGRRRVCILSIRYRRADIHRAETRLRSGWSGTTVPGSRQASTTRRRDSITRRLSPDETLVAASRPEADTNREQLWLLDLRRSVVSRFAFDASSHAMPLWSRDGKTLVFASGGDLYRQTSDGSEQPELLFKSAEAKRPHDWSPDGEYIVYAVMDPKTQWDIWLLAIVRRPPPETLPSDPLPRVSRTYLSGWPLDRVRVGRVRVDGSLSAIVSDSRTEAPDFHERRRRTAVAA